ncbi:uncharacterized protein MYCFIDRAFT_85129 [Pseudocercospora fijiensis CIRAD86]|uniref:Uncharacterized protein n=1 Tax=Pseudocercospora fijiensis (strain CIRAD86) TaxID=383855 RepID=M3AIX9_PSEFD|nr:uncharacterized protein MYCFIDRAFT_85129 [Pseudocercospora fijiensis CIRAD86]EME77432.1 hypothetical protein MYCFIDRAFT_85129 [Pseudocercospora fijiensis CIRAD86]
MTLSRRNALSLQGRCPYVESMRRMCPELSGGASDGTRRSLFVRFPPLSFSFTIFEHHIIGMDASTIIFATGPLHSLPIQHRQTSTMKPVDPPSGRRAVAIIHDDNLEVVLDMSSPLYQSIRLQERKDSYVWKSLPLTSKLGVPLKFKLLKDGSPGPSSNKSLELLSLECDPESDDFGEPVHLFEEVVLVARQDDMDLLPKQMRAIIAFLDSELLPLVQYGIQKDDIDESGGDSDSAGSPSEQNHEQGTLREDSLQRQESGGDDSAAEEHLEISSTTAQPDVVTKQEAEDALSRINPENFISFFDSHRAEQAKEDITWKLTVKRSRFAEGVDVCCTAVRSARRPTGRSIKQHASAWCINGNTQLEFVLKLLATDLCFQNHFQPIGAVDIQSSEAWANTRRESGFEGSRKYEL